MPHPDLPALVASRICHDLAGPIGAVANGVELLGLTGGGEGAETALIAESVAEANARLRFMRLALGKGENEGTVAARDLREILAALTGGGRIALRWRPEEDPGRGEVRAVLLAMMCLEKALPAGGTITASAADDGTHIEAAGRIVPGDAPWDSLEGGPPPEDLPAGRVEFALLPMAVETLGRGLRLTRGTERMTISF